MIRLTKKLENKFFVDSLEDEKILSCEAGYRLVTIKAFNCLEAEGVKLSELLIELYSEEFNMYLYDYEFYSDDDHFFEFQVCVDEEYLKEFNTLYNQFKKSVNDLLEVEEEEEILKAEEETIETEKEEIIEEKVIETEKESFLEAEFEFATQGDIDFRFSKKLEPKYYEYNGKKELNAQEGYRLYIISITNGDLEDANELITDLQKMASLKGIHCFKYDMDEYNNLSMTSKIQFAVDDSHLKEFNKVYKEWAEGWSLNSEEKKEETKYQIGQILYNCGDMANNAGWYKITNINIDKFGVFYDVKEIGGNRENTYPEYCISEIDRMNGSTRIVTKEARIKATNETYVKNALTSLILKDANEKDHEEKIKETEEVNKEWYKITDHEEEEKKEIINDLVETCNAGIKTEKEIKIYFNRLAKDQRTKVINKFQREKKGLDINLFYYNTFLNEEFYLSELKELRSKIVKYLDFLDNFKNSIIEEINNYNEQIKNFKKEKEPFYNNTFKILKDEDFKIVKLNADITFGNGNLCYIDEYTIYHKDLGYASMNGQTPYIPEGGRVALKAMINEKTIDSIPHWIESAKFKYTYRSRGFSPSCQPMNGLINHENQKGYKFEVLTYNRKLTCKEISDFELIDLNE